jgi:hypothetical protein
LISYLDTITESEKEINIAELSNDLDIDIPELVSQLQQKAGHSTNDVKVEQDKGDFIIKSGYKMLKLKPSY